MAGVTPEMIQEYIQRKGGRVKNVDLVKHFRKHLLFDDPVMKDQAREIFKEKVNSVAVIRQEEKEKFLYLKDDLNVTSHDREPQPQTRQTQPQTRLSQSESIGGSVSPPQSPLRQQTGGPHPHTSLRDTAQNKDNGIIPGHLQNGGRMDLEQRVTSPQHKPHPSPIRANVGGNSSSAMPTSTSGPYDYYSRYSRPVATPSNNTPTTQASATSLYKPISTRKDSPSHNGPATPNDNSLNRRSGKPTDLSSLRTSKIESHPSQPPTNDLSAGDSLSSLGGSDSDMLQIFTEGLTNFGKTGIFSDTSLLSDMEGLMGGVTTSTGTTPVAPTSTVTIVPTSTSTTTINTSSAGTSPSLLSSHVPAPPPRVSSRLQASSPRVMSRPLSSSGGNIPTVSSIPPDGSPQRVTSSSPLHHQQKAPPTKQPSTDNAPSPPRTQGGTSSSPRREGDNSVSPVVTVTRTPSDRERPPEDDASMGGGVRQLIRQYTPSPTNDRSTPSPTHYRGTPSPVHLRGPSSPTHPSTLLSPTHSEGGKVTRSVSSVSSGSMQYGGKDGLQRTGSNVGTLTRRSRALNSNLDNLTRQSIKGVGPKSHRMSKTSDEMSISREELLSNEQDRDSPEEFLLEIDPTEKEWLHALIDGNIDVIHRLVMSDKQYVNRKDFLNGWTALHWAAKLGNIELMSALIFSGALVDIKSNGGMTPLHIAAEAGNELVMRSLVLEHNASVNTRDHSGLRPLDMLNPGAPESARSVLRNGLTHVDYHGPMDVSKAFGSMGSFNIPRQSGNGQGRPLSTVSTLNRNWSSMGQITDKEVEKKSRHHHMVSPRTPRKGFSFRRKNRYQINHSNRNSTTEEKYRKYE